MTGSFAIIFNICSISPRYIGMPNGAQTRGNLKGSVRLGPKLTLHYVIYFPYLTCNLRSVSQLLHFNPK